MSTLFNCKIYFAVIQFEDDRRSINKVRIFAHDSFKCLDASNSHYVFYQCHKGVKIQVTLYTHYGKGVIIVCQLTVGFTMCIFCFVDWTQVVLFTTLHISFSLIDTRSFTWQPCMILSTSWNPDLSFVFVEETHLLSWIPRSSVACLRSWIF